MEGDSVGKKRGGTLVGIKLVNLVVGTFVGSNEGRLLGSLLGTTLRACAGTGLGHVEGK